MKRIPAEFWAIVAIILLGTLPYLAAVWQAPDGWVFNGFLANPGDGASYLGKMRQGYEGSWLFTLPFSAQPGEPTALFLFYLFLGHVARWTGLSLPLVFHLARVIGAAALAAALGRFYRRVLNPAAAVPALLMAMFGGGFGWLLLLFGTVTADLWLTEAYPFLSSLTNPHFPLALALMTLILARPANGLWGLAAYALGGLALGIVLPFAAALTAVVLLLTALLSREGPQGARWLRSAIAAGVGGAPMLAYQFWLTQTHPQIAAWNAQNITWSPAPWEMVLALSPALLVAALCTWGWLRTGLPDRQRVLAAWAAAAVLLPYVPWALQRRLFLGALVPLSGLAAAWFFSGGDKRRMRWGRYLMAISWITPLLFLLILIIGSRQLSLEIFLPNELVRAYEALSGEPKGQVVLANESISRWLPGYTGQRAVLGHDFETIHAEREAAWVERAIQAYGSGQAVVDGAGERDVAYLIWGPVERASEYARTPNLPVFGQFGDYTIYCVPGKSEP